MNTVLVQEMERYNMYGKNCSVQTCSKSSPILYNLTFFFVSQTMWYNPRKPTEPVESHQRFGGDGCRVGGSCEQFASGQGPREMGQALIS